MVHIGGHEHELHFFLDDENAPIADSFHNGNLSLAKLSINSPKYQKQMSEQRVQ